MTTSVNEALADVEVLKPLVLHEGDIIALRYKGRLTLEEVENVRAMVAAQGLRAIVMDESWEVVATPSDAGGDS